MNSLSPRLSCPKNTRCLLGTVQAIISASPEPKHSLSKRLFVSPALSSSLAGCNRNFHSHPTQKGRNKHPPVQICRTQPQLPGAATTQRVQSYSSRSTETYIAYGVTRKLFEVCSKHADYKVPQALEKGTEIPKTAAGEDIGVGNGWWYEDLGLLPTFASWSQVTFLHMYLITVRLRAFPSTESYQIYSRHFIDHFSHEAERRMDVLHGITSRAIRVKYLKDIFLQWRGVLAAYDEGLIKGDAVLASAVWRNLWKGAPTDHNGQEQDWNKVAHVVAYMRQTLTQLEAIPNSSLVQVLSGDSDNGAKDTIFNPRKSIKKLPEYKSRGITEPFDENDDSLRG